MSSPQLKVVNDIVVSQEDDRLYRGLELPNGLKVLLVSDPTADKAAAAMDVHVGSLSDPRNLPGLAHFLEHMLFLGTEKFPDESGYNQYLSKNSGGSNAYTATDHTNYYFDVAPEAFPGALDRFSQFFIAPLFTEAATERELKAVNSEHEKNVQSDAWRLQQLERSMSEPDHDFNKFGTGNLQTLDVDPKSKGISTRDELLAFHSKYYSANIMALALINNTSLDELQTLVLSLFSDVKNKNVEVPSWPDHPWRDTNKGTKTYFTPVKDIRGVNMTFPIPDQSEHYLAKPGYYLGHLIGHEGPGSLLSELKARKLVNSLYGGYKPGAVGFGFFTLNVDLTEDGAKEECIEEIISLAFQYLAMLRTEGPQERIYHEQCNLQSMHFRFKDKERPQGMVCSLAGALHKYNMKEVLSGPWLVKEWKPELISNILERLTPENVRVTVIGQTFEDLCTEREFWYQTKYLTKKFSDESLKKWTECGDRCESFHLPETNVFIPTNFDQYPRDEESGPVPIILKETPLVRLWYKQDDEFCRPKANINFSFESPLVYCDPHHTSLASLFLKLFKDDLSEYAYDADLSGLYYSLTNTKRTIELDISGYNEKQHVLLDKVMDKFVGYKVSPERFEVIKDLYVRGLQNFRMNQPHSHASFYHTLLLTERAWSKDELIEEIPNLTMEAVQDFGQRFFKQMHVEGLMHGNVNQEEALRLLNVIESKLEAVGTRPLAPSMQLRMREICLDPGTEHRFVTTTDVHKSSCALSYYQCNRQGTRVNMLLEMVAQLLVEPCFSVLRTKEQLGYIVFSGVRRSLGTQGLRVIVQSDRHPEYLDQRIELFLKEQIKDIESMTEEEFNKHKTAVTNRRLEKPKSLNSRTNKYEAEIGSGQYNFDRDNLETKELETITKAEVLAFYKEFIASDEVEVLPNRKKMSCHVVSMIEEGAGVAEKELNDSNPGICTAIKDTSDFKQALSLFPRMSPFQEFKTLRAKQCILK